MRKSGGNNFSPTCGTDFHRFLRLTEILKSKVFLQMFQGLDDHFFFFSETEPNII